MIEIPNFDPDDFIDDEDAIIWLIEYALPECDPEQVVSILRGTANWIEKYKES